MRGPHSELSTAVVLITSSSRLKLLHPPSVADDDRLASQGVGTKGGQEQGGLGDIVHRGELTINGVPQHDVLDHVLLGNAKCLGLFGDLLVHQGRPHKARGKSRSP